MDMNSERQRDYDSLVRMAITEYVLQMNEGNKDLRKTIARLEKEAIDTAERNYDMVNTAEKRREDCNAMIKEQEVEIKRLKARKPKVVKTKPLS